MYKKGDLVEYRGGLATVIRDEYTARFLDEQDHDMIAHGMGQFAGSYGGAVDLVMLGEMTKFQKVRRSDVKLVNAGPDNLLTT